MARSSVRFGASHRADRYIYSPLHAHSTLTTEPLSNLTTAVMYLDFHAGRLKLTGTLAFPKSKYLVLGPGQKEQVACEDVFESVVGE